MIVENDSSVTGVLEENLHRWGHTAESYCDGAEAYEAIFRACRKFDVVLCDLNLPGMMGRDLLEKASSVLRGRTPFVIVSGHSALIQNLGDVRLDAAAILRKPFELVDLEFVLEHALRLGKLYARCAELEDRALDMAGRTDALLNHSRELSRAVRMDPLTEIANRIGLREDLSRADARRLESGQGFAVALIDVDDFGRFNRDHGVEVGDEALRRLAAALRSACRECDVECKFGDHEAEAAFRLGGDEFVLILSASNDAAAARAMTRIQRQVRALLDGAPDPLPGGPVTTSAGVVASTPDRQSSTEELLREAGKRLKEAKRVKGDSVCARSEDGTEEEDQPWLASSA